MPPDGKLLNESRLHEKMAALKLDAVVATSPENVTYSSGFWALPQWIRRGPQTYVLWPAPERGEPEIITSTGTLDLIADQPIWVEKVRRYGDFHIDQGPEPPRDAVSLRLLEMLRSESHRDAIEALAVAIGKAGLARSRIGIDEIGLMPGQFGALEALLPDATFIPATSLFRDVRAVKTEEEITRLGIVAQIAERSIAAALDLAEEGSSEVELARAFHVQTVRDDALPVLGCIGFGERSALMNVQPSDRTLRLGDVIRFDVGGRYRHYRADIARIATFGEASKQVRDLHHALLSGIERACEMIRPGVRVADVHDATVETVRREGIRHYRRNHVGHGIGLDGYDAPSLTASSEEVFEENMVLSVETPYYEIGRFGLQVEDMVVVRRDGVERLMTTSGDLVVVPQ
ncbi:MAG: aminopeptidase P family protein [Rhizobiaceae bacterium]|nr:MAG: aminopeptidase P family protein [Rhizobiaceae bacterium]